MTNPKTNFILFGASRLGKDVLTRLTRAGYQAIAYADNDPKKQGTVIDGLHVLSPAEAAKSFSDTTFIITIYTHSRVREQVAGLGIHSLTLSEFALNFPEAFLPFYYLEAPKNVAPWHDAIVEAAALWSDFASLQCFFEQVYHRMTLNALHTPFTDPVHTYFDDDIFRLGENEVFVNCGAYDGDTVRAFLEKSKGRFKKIFAVEPDKNNFSKLSATTKPYGEKIEIVNVAAFDKEGSIFFNESGDVQSSVTDKKTGTEVATRTVDSIVKGEKVTLIQMDIEGSEPKAIDGCRETIRRDSPVLAICLYHRLEDVWEIPRQINRINQNYNFYLKRYSDDGWELVLYCVPTNRTLTRSGQVKLSLA